MRNRRAKLSTTVVVILLLIAVIALRVHPRSVASACEEDVQTRRVAPDGRWTAEEVVELCHGALRSQSTKVVIREGGEDRAAVFEMAGIGNIKMTWQDARHLVVGYPASAVTSTKLEKFDDVSVEYSIETGQ